MMNRGRPHIPKNLPFGAFPAEPRRAKPPAIPLLTIILLLSAAHATTAQNTESPPRAIPVEPTRAPRAIPVNPPAPTPTPAPNTPGTRSPSTPPPVRPAEAVEQPVRRAEPVLRPDPTPAATPVRRPAATPDPETDRREMPTPTPQMPTPTPPLATPTATPTPTPAPIADPAPRSPGTDGQSIRVTPGASASVPPDEVLFRVASGLYKDKHYDLAAPEFEKYLSLYPRGAQRDAALFRLGESYRNLEQEGRARNVYRQLINEFRRGPFVGSAAYRLAETMVRDNNLEAARSYFELAAENLEDPKVKLAAMYREGRCLENLGRRESARAVYRRVLEVGGENPYRDSVLLALAQIAEATGRQREALESYAALAADAAKPEMRAEAGVNAGVLATSMERQEEARSHFEAVTRIPIEGKWQNLARVGLLRLDYENGEYQKVIETYSQNPDAFPEELIPEARLLVANSHRQLNEYGKARDLYEAIINEFPNSNYAVDAKYQRLVSLYSMESPDLVPAAGEFLEMHPSGAKADQARLLKAEAHYRNGEFQEAGDSYSLLKDSGLPAKFLPEVLYKLGWCRQQTEQHAEAVEAYTEFLDRFPASEEEAAVLAQRGMAYQRMGELDAALTDFNHIAADFPDARESEVALQQKGLILGQKKDNQGMVDSFEKLLARFPETEAAAQANYWIGWAAFEDKQYADAVAPLRRSRELDPEGYGERASLRVILSHYYLENPDAAAAEVDAYQQAGYRQMLPSDILYWLGNAFLEDGKPGRAENYLERLTTRENVQPPPPEAWLALSQARTAGRKWDMAIEAARNYLENAESPGDQAVGHLAIARAHLGSGNTQSARSQVEEALRLQPEGRLNAEARMIEGDIEMAETRYVEASKAYQRVAVLYDDEEIAPKAMESAYLALSKAGNGVEADQLLNELRTRFPEYRIESAPDSDTR